MDRAGQMGLTRRQLEYEVKWRMRQAPKDPARLTHFLTDLMVELIDKNNQAIATAIAEKDRQDLPEDA